MKNIFVITLFAALIITSCGSGGSAFRLTGRLLNINQGEFYVYSAEEDVQGVDTIKVQAGRFEYKKEIPRATTLMIVFPNFTEQPIFAEPGGRVKIDGDASHLKDMTAEGSNDNKLMNTIRPRLADATEQQQLQITRDFITKHPTSRVGLYLVRRCILQSESPDFATAKTLISKMLAAQPKNGALIRMQKELQGRSAVKKNQTIPNFKATDTNGKTVDIKSLQQAEVGVVMTWTSWNVESVNALRQLNRMKKKVKSRLQIVAISLDTSTKECIKRIERDSIRGSIVCDEQAIDGSLYRSLGFMQTGEALILKKGKLTDHPHRADEITKQTEKALGLSHNDY